MNQEKPNHHTHKCVIAVDERGDCILLKSSPSLYEFDTFDGSSLHDNINHKTQLIPTEFGIYTCDINTKCVGYWTECGTEYDNEIWLDNICKLEINI